MRLCLFYATEFFLRRKIPREQSAPPLVTNLVLELDEATASRVSKPVQTPQYRQYSRNAHEIPGATPYARVARASAG